MDQQSRRAHCSDQRPHAPLQSVSPAVQSLTSASNNAAVLPLRSQNLAFMWRAAAQGADHARIRCASGVLRYQGLSGLSQCVHGTLQVAPGGVASDGETTLSPVFRNAACDPILPLCERWNGHATCWVRGRGQLQGAQGSAAEACGQGLALQTDSVIPPATARVRVLCNTTCRKRLKPPPNATRTTGACSSAHRRAQQHHILPAHSSARGQTASRASLRTAEDAHLRAVSSH